MGTSGGPAAARMEGQGLAGKKQMGGWGADGMGPDCGLRMEAKGVGACGSACAALRALRHRRRQRPPA